jgi:hypothetical protein
MSDQLPHPVLVTVYALLERYDVVGVHARSALQRQEHVVQVQRHRQLLSPQSRAQMQQPLQYTPELPLLHLLPTVQQVLQSIIVIFREDVRHLVLNANPLLCISAQLH